MTYPKTFVSKYLEQETKFSDIAKVRKALFDLRQSYLVVKRDQEFPVWLNILPLQISILKLSLQVFFRPSTQARWVTQSFAKPTM